MKVQIILLGLFLASVAANILEPKSIRFHEQSQYKYRYTGNVLTGLPSVSNQYTGYQINADVLLSGQPGDIVLMQWTNISLGQSLGEVTDLDNVNWARSAPAYLRSQLEKPVKFEMKTGQLQWVEFDSAEDQWSVNIKKSFIDLLQVDLEAKKTIRGDYLTEKVGSQRLPTLTSYGVFEKGIKGICETNYDVFQSVETSVPSYVQGAQYFAFNVTKTRNYQNCLESLSLVADNWDRKGCSEYCSKQAQAHLSYDNLNSYVPAPEETSCACEIGKSSPVDQYTTVRYNITLDAQTPTIEGIHASGKVVVDNHGSEIAVLTHQWVHLIGKTYSQSARFEMIGTPIRSQSLTFSTYNASETARTGHKLPFYNLFVPMNLKQIMDTARMYIETAAQQVLAGNIQDNSRTNWHITRFIQNLAYLNGEQIAVVFRLTADIPKAERYTNSLKSIQRQLFLDAVSHVGTNDVVDWLEIALKKGQLLDFEAKQIIELLPRNLYYPSEKVLNIFKQRIEGLEGQTKKNALLASWTVSFGKLVAKACKPTEWNEEDKTSRFWTPEVYGPYRTLYGQQHQQHWSEVRKTAPWERQYAAWESESICTPQQAEQYVNWLGDKMIRANTFHEKMVYAQGLAHTGQVRALAILTPFISGTVLDSQCPGYLVEDVSRRSEECNFFRASIIYSIHNMIHVNPKLIRSMVLPVYRNTQESYEVRLAAFTLFMCTGPQRHELESVAASLKHEVNRQVISMVTSILEETANMTQPCNLPLAKAARDVLPSLPKVNLDGVYSQASYNEYYSHDVNHGFYLNGQHVANNISVLPRHGYLSFGAHWGSYSSSWFTLAYQQKGFEGLLRRLMKPGDLLAEMTRNPSLVSASGRSSSSKVDEIFRKLNILERTDEDPKAKIFVKLYEQTALFTLDRETIKEAFIQFSEMFAEYSQRLTGRGNFHWVRFFMPAGLNRVVASDIGLPVFVSKVHPHIVALKIEDTKVEMTRSGGFNVTTKVTPQVLYTSVLSVSAFKQAITENTGVSSIKRSFAILPVRVSLGYNLLKNMATFSVIPEMGKKIFLQQTLNRIFKAKNTIGTEASPFYQKVELNALASPYVHQDRIEAPAFGMDLSVSLKTQAPWFLDVQQIFRQNMVQYIIEKYGEMSQFNHEVQLELNANQKFPVYGYAGSVRYHYDVSEERLADNIEFTNVYDRNNLVHTVFNKKGLKSLAKQFWPELEMPEEEQLDEQSWEINEADNIYEYQEVSRDVYGRSDKFMLKEKVNRMMAKFPGQTGIDEPVTVARNLIWTLWTIAPQPTYAAGNLVLVHTVDHTTCWLKFDGLFTSKARYWERFPKVWSLESVLGHAQLPGELSYEPVSREGHDAKFETHIKWGSDEAKPRIVIRGKMERSEEELVAGKHIYSTVKPWYFSQCQQDKSIGKQLSFACQLAAWETGYFNKVDMTITYTNLPREFVNITRKVYGLAKLSGLAYWRPFSTVSSYEADNEEGTIEINAKHSNILPEHPMINVEIKTPRENTHFRRLFAPINRFPDFYPPMYKKASVFPKDQTCGLMEKYIRTFDNVTFEKPRSDCEYVLAMDCSPAKKFAVIVKENTDDTKTVKVYFRDEVIEVLPKINRKFAKVIVSGKQVNVEFGKPIVLNEKHEISTVNIFLHADNLVIAIPFETLRVVTDGKLVKVTTSAGYIGKTCGLCGNQDQEAHMEFQGPRNTIYSRPEAFLRSYSLSQCSISGGRMESKEYGMRVPAIRRNLVVKGEKENCFSKYSVPNCPGELENGPTEQIPVEFICLPRHQVMSGQWAIEADRRLLHEITPLTATKTITVDVPFHCISKESTRGL